MTDTTQGQDAARGHFEPRITQHFYGNGDRRPQPQPRYSDAPRDPNTASNGAGTALAILIGLLAAFALVALFMNGGNFNCDTQCWQTKKELGLAKYTTDRAIANSDANARAGFGNDDDTTRQTAVAPPPRTTIHESRPQVTTTTPCCAVVGTGVATPDGPGRCWMDPKGPMAGHRGYLWADTRCHLRAE
jgi:hypothetical protein